MKSAEGKYGQSIIGGQTRDRRGSAWGAEKIGCGNRRKMASELCDPQGAGNRLVRVFYSSNKNLVLRARILYFAKPGESPEVGFEGSNKTPLKGVTRDSRLSYPPLS
jgi:hypothetical protein